MRVGSLHFSVEDRNFYKALKSAKFSSQSPFYDFEHSSCQHWVEVKWLSCKENMRIAASVPVSSLDVTDACKEFHAGGMAGMNEFASPGYPQKYPPGRDCVRVIEAPLGHDILIHFRHVFQVISMLLWDIFKNLCLHLVMKILYYIFQRWYQKQLFAPRNFESMTYWS